MRFYSAGNVYLSSIQQGIQAAHCVAEMSRMWPTGKSMFSEWRTYHKTIICVNGGNNASLNELYNLFTREDNPGYQVAKFHEDEQSMGGMLTCVGIVVPEQIYLADLTDPLATARNLTPWEIEVATALKQMPLAR